MSEAKTGGAVSTYTIIGTADASGKAQSVSPTTPVPVDGSSSATLDAPSAAVSVTTTATVVQAANTSRKEARFQPTNGDIYWGKDNTVTILTGVKVSSGATWIEDRYKGAIYAIAASTIDVRHQELT